MIGDQFKYDNDKPQLDLVPMGIVEAIGYIRSYGIKKYTDPDGWKKVEVRRYIAATLRHWIEFMRDNHSVDKESGLPHLWHCACNMAFLVELVTGVKVADKQEKQESELLDKLAEEYMSHCDCQCNGDMAAGIQPCPFYNAPDIGAFGEPLHCGCELAEYDKKGQA